MDKIVDRIASFKTAIDLFGDIFPRHLRVVPPEAIDHGIDLSVGVRHGCLYLFWSGSVKL